MPLSGGVLPATREEYYMKTQRWLLAMALANLAGVVGCASENQEDRSVASQQPISGELGTTIACSGPEVQKLSDTLYQMRTALESPKMLEALKENVLTGSYHGPDNMAPGFNSAYPEWIISRMTEDMPTNIRCDSMICDDEGCGECGAEGCAQMCIDNETIVLGHAAIDTYDTVNLARLIAHEVVHNKCYFDEWRVASQIPGVGILRAIEDALVKVMTGDPIAAFRSGLLPETTLAPVGLDYETAGTGLSDLDSTCPGDDIATGLWASYTPGQGPSSMSLYCKPKFEDTPLVLSPVRGHGGPQAGQYLCSDGDVLVGFHGHSDEQMRAVGPLCASRTAVHAATNYDNAIALPHFGPDTGLTWRRQCPPARVVKGFRVRNDRANGSYPVTHFEVVCQSLNEPESVTLSDWDGPVLGGATRMFYVERCPGRQVLTTLISTFAARSINRLGSECTNVVGSGQDATIGTYPSSPLPAYGGWSGEDLYESVSVAQDDCPAGRALVGLNTYVDSSGATPRIRGLQGVCADFARWNSLGDPMITQTPARGAIGEGNWQTYYCPRGAYLNGWRIAEEYGLTGIQGVCRAFVNTFTPPTLNSNLWTTEFGYGEGSGNWRVDMHPRLTADINGDGRSDIIGFGNAGAYVALSSGIGFSPSALGVAEFGYGSGWRTDRHPRLMADVNDDDKADIVGFGEAGTYVALSTGSGFATPTLWTNWFGADSGWRVESHPRLVVDVNDDHKADIVGFGNAGTYVAFSRGDNAFWPATLKVAEFGYNSGWRVDMHPRMMAYVNKDKWADIVGFGNAGVYVALSKGIEFSAPQLWLAEFGYNSGGWRVDMHPRMMADVNGDGMDDIIGFGNAGVYVALSTGSGFSNSGLWLAEFGYNSGWRVESHPRLMADMNGDGKADIVGFGNAGTYVAYSTGSGFTPAKLSTAAYGYDSGGWRVPMHPRMLADTTGDGRANIIGFGNDGVWVTVP
jgi:hypothetical protein